MTEKTPCPDPDRWTALLDEDLPEAEQLELSSHLAGCNACRQMLERLSGSDGLSVALAEGGTCDQSEQVRKLVEEIKTRKLDATVELDPPSCDPHQANGCELGFLDPPVQPSMMGKLGRYDVHSVVGAGGMGIVLKAHDPTLNRIVAIKVLSPQLATNAVARKRFLREAQAAAAISHDHVVTIHAVEEARGLPFLVMEYIAGTSLAERINRDGPLPLEKILRIGTQAASGLAAAHTQGLVHRDIKPSNILLENGVERVKISDFGLARARDDAQITQTGAVAGTPEYMSPEQASGKTVDQRSDLFSLGCVLYAMCCGRSPFRASTVVDAIRRVCDDTPRPIPEVNPSIPDSLAEIIDCLLAKDPAERPQSAAQLAELLSGLLAQVQQPSQLTSKSQLQLRRPSPKRRRSPVVPFPAPWTAAALVLVPLGLVVGGYLMVAGMREPPALPTKGKSATPAVSQHGASFEVQILKHNVSRQAECVSVAIQGDGFSRTLVEPGDYTLTVPPGTYEVTMQFCTMNNFHRQSIEREFAISAKAKPTDEATGSKTTAAAKQPIKAK